MTITWQGNRRPVNHRQSRHGRIARRGSVLGAAINLLALSFAGKSSS